MTLRAAKPSGTIDGFLGLLAGKTNKVATLDEINEAAASGWAGPAGISDGVIAFDGQWLGGDIFVSFDKKAVAVIAEQGQPARILV